MKKSSHTITYLLLFLLAGKYGYTQNEFYNNGSAITIQAGALVTVRGEVVNTNAGANVGLINNSGLISFSGNWTNHSTSGALVATTGSVDMTGANQGINGSQPTRFNNLNLLGSGVKTLNVNTFVSGATGVLALGTRPLDLNSKSLIVTNPSTGAITRSTGYIISETAPVPGYGTIQWNIGNTGIGNYVFPFGSLTAGYIPLTLSVTSPGVQSTTGAIRASTYPTNTAPALNNRPLPVGVTHLTNNCNTDHAPKMLDRYWVIDTINYTVSPVISRQLTYIENEWDLIPGSSNIITESDLQAYYYNNAAWITLPGTNNSASNIQTIPANSNYGVFTLGEYKQLNLQLLDVDSVVCFGESNGAITFSSNPGYGSPTYSINASAVTNTVVNTLAAGSYTIVGRDIMGCGDTLQPIIVSQPLQLLLSLTSSDYSICRNDTIKLTSNFSGGIKPYSINWSTGLQNTGVTTNSLTIKETPQASTGYWIELKDRNNCEIRTATINVNVNPVPVVNFNADPKVGCQPLPVNFTNLSAATPSVSTWLWNFGNGASSSLPSPACIYSMPGTFDVSLKAVTDSGCVTIVKQQNYIVVHPKPTASFYYTPESGIDILNPEVSFQNTSTGFDNAFWNFGEGSDIVSQDHAMHFYTDTGVFRVGLVVTTIHNCVDSIRIPLKVNEISTIYVPNAFTPDENSLNEVFMPVGIGMYDYRMQIFNRWGEKIFESSVPNEGWNGKYGGTLCKEGVYVYKMEFKATSGALKRRSQTLVGHVTLIHLAK